jgi:surfactin synthase thioesterase subunit
MASRKPPTMAKRLAIANMPESERKMWEVLASWRAKASSTVTGHSLDCGHFLQEERPEETFEELQHFFGTV